VVQIVFAGGYVDVALFWHPLRSLLREGKGRKIRLLLLSVPVVLAG
jgi:hypothetical protein